MSSWRPAPICQEPICTAGELHLQHFLFPVWQLFLFSSRNVLVRSSSLLHTRLLLLVSWVFTQTSHRHQSYAPTTTDNATLTTRLGTLLDRQICHKSFQHKNIHHSLYKQSNCSHIFVKSRTRLITRANKSHTIPNRCGTFISSDIQKKCDRHKNPALKFLRQHLFDRIALANRILRKGFRWQISQMSLQYPLWFQQTWCSSPPEISSWSFQLHIRSVNYLTRFYSVCSVNVYRNNM